MLVIFGGCVLGYWVLVLKCFRDRVDYVVVDFIGAVE